MRLQAILAMARDGAIGKGGTLPWDIGADLARFKRLTTGHAIIMGRRTFESIGKNLPGRFNIVLTRNIPPVCPRPNAVARTVEEALAIARNYEAGMPSLSGLEPEPFVIGGAGVYQAFWPHVCRVELTEVHADYPDADVRFSFDRRVFQETARDDSAAVRRVEHPGVPGGMTTVGYSFERGYSFVTLERVRCGAFFYRLADGVRVECRLGPHGEEIAHAW